MIRFRRTAAFVACATLVTLPRAFASSQSSVSINLQWTAPGDDGTVGTATAYDLVYSTAPITQANFDLATHVGGLPQPAPAGSIEHFTVNGFDPTRTYYFALESVDNAGNWSRMSNVLTFSPQTLAVDTTSFTLSFSAPWPNPARALARCSFVLPRAAPVRVDVFDLMGRHVRTLASGARAAGRAELTWDLRDDEGRAVATGIYLVHAQLDDRTWKERIAVVR
jgi:hypothetical protein